MRELIKIDSKCAFEVEYLNGTGEHLECESRKHQKGCPKVTVRVDADWHAFCQALYKGIEG